MDVPVSAIYPDPLSVLDEPGGLLYTDHSRQSVLAGDDRAVSHKAPNLCHESLDCHEERRPARVGVGRDQDVVGLEVCLADLMDDAGSPCGDSARDRKADECAGREVVTSVPAGDDFAVGGEHARWRQRLMRTE